MRKTLLVTICCVMTAVVGTIVLGYLCPRLCGPSDAVEAVGMQTREKLKAYEVSSDPADLKTWLAPQEMDAAYGMEKCIVLAEWAKTHQNLFIRLVETLQSKDQEVFAALFASSLQQSSSEEAFISAFNKHSSSVLDRIKNNLNK